MFSPNRKWTRRDFLRLVGQAGLITAANPALANAATLPDTVRISILHTTDLHGHILPTFDYNGNPNLGGLARCATQIRRWRKENPNSILIDIGDVYQGTDVSWRNKGELMIDLFNHLRYDAWIVGNHEFDWEIDVFQNAVAKSTMPVLGANALIEGKPAGAFSEQGNPLARIQPFILKEIAGIKVAIIGVTTPGMTFWFRPEFIRGMEFTFPVEPVRQAVAAVKALGADAIILAGHMGLKPHSGGDDFANCIMSLTSEFPETDVFIAGHTHQLIANRATNRAVVTQADHFGIYVGRVDLLFDRSTKKLLAREPRCELMDSRIRFDPVVLSRAKSQLAESETALAETVGELAETFHARGRPGKPSDVERLIGAAIIEALAERGVQIDGVFHGVFDEGAVIPAGPKTVNDIWALIPYENYLVTAELMPDEIKAVMEEAYSSYEERNLIGFELVLSGRGRDRHISSIALGDGRPLERARRFLIAFNTFDSRSGGHRFMKLRSLLERPESNCAFHPVQTRDTLIDYFRRHKVVQRIALTPGLISIAA